MRIHNTNLQYGIKNQLVLMQEHICNVCRVSIIVANRIQEMRKIINYIYFIYSAICILRARPADG